jgi:hypothetical protein
MSVFVAKRVDAQPPPPGTQQQLWVAQTNWVDNQLQNSFDLLPRGWYNCGNTVVENILIETRKSVFNAQGQQTGWSAWTVANTIPVNVADAQGNKENKKQGPYEMEMINGKPKSAFRITFGIVDGNNNTMKYQIRSTARAAGDAFIVAGTQNVN